MPRRTKRSGISRKSRRTIKRKTRRDTKGASRRTIKRKNVKRTKVNKQKLSSRKLKRRNLRGGTRFSIGDKVFYIQNPDHLFQTAIKAEIVHVDGEYGDVTIKLPEGNERQTTPDRIMLEGKGAEAVLSEGARIAVRLNRCHEEIVRMREELATSRGLGDWLREAYAEQRREMRKLGDYLARVTVTKQSNFFDKPKEIEYGLDKQFNIKIPRPPKGLLDEKEYIVFHKFLNDHRRPVSFSISSFGRFLQTDPSIPDKWLDMSSPDVAKAWQMDIPSLCFINQGWVQLLEFLDNNQRLALFFRGVGGDDTSYMTRSSFTEVIPKILALYVQFFPDAVITETNNDPDVFFNK